MTQIELVESNDPVAVPWRVALIRPDQRPAVRQSEEKYVMTFPHLIMRELIMFQLVVIGLSLAAIFFDAPLESIANPVETPNPAKAPWYFLGLQELLHYFPPVVAGVLLPALVVIALIVIPYAKTNLRARPLWESGSRIKPVLIGALVVALVALFSFFQCWPVVIPTAIIGGAMFLARSMEPRLQAMEPRLQPGSPAKAGAPSPATVGAPSPARAGAPFDWLYRVTLPEWIMTWFVVIAVTLTIIGTFFRGPGWSWVWPWD